MARFLPRCVAAALLAEYMMVPMGPLVVSNSIISIARIHYHIGFVQNSMEMERGVLEGQD